MAAQFVLEKISEEDSSPVKLAVLTLALHRLAVFGKNSISETRKLRPIVSKRRPHWRPEVSPPEPVLT